MNMTILSKGVCSFSKRIGRELKNRGMRPGETKAVGYVFQVFPCVLDSVEEARSERWSSGASGTASWNARRAHLGGRGEGGGSSL